MKIPSYGDRFTTFGRRRSLFPASRVFSRSGLFLRRLKISSAVHDEIILEEILFNLLISSVICILGWKWTIFFGKDGANGVIIVTFTQ